ncbi:hypothetical protein HYC85_021425 [Camellia sinensis]|uniref:non-specific serine/threonine protein kinase n=1 Tax=Camellia sinensis TaxID=4442 RepID=A0A7J7GLL8_CAMSI|nr:hypothetical protein HYC85_021425 [Camellia sinensis]
MATTSPSPNSSPSAISPESTPPPPQPSSPPPPQPSSPQLAPLTTPSSDPNANPPDLVTPSPPSPPPQSPPTPNLTSPPPSSLSHHHCSRLPSSTTSPPPQSVSPPPANVPPPSSNSPPPPPLSNPPTISPPPPSSNATSPPPPSADPPAISPPPPSSNPPTGSPPPPLSETPKNSPPPPQSKPPTSSPTPPSSLPPENSPPPPSSKPPESSPPPPASKQPPPSPASMPPIASPPPPPSPASMPPISSPPPPPGLNSSSSTPSASPPIASPPPPASKQPPPSPASMPPIASPPPPPSPASMPPISSPPPPPPGLNSSTSTPSASPPIASPPPPPGLNSSSSIPSASPPSSNSPPKLLPPPPPIMHQSPPPPLLLSPPSPPPPSPSQVPDPPSSNLTTNNSSANAPEISVTTGNGGLSTGGTVAIGLALSFLLLSLIGIAAWCIRRQKKKVSGINGGYILPTSSSYKSDSALLKAQSLATHFGSSSGSDIVYSPSEPGGLGSSSRSWFTYEELVEATNGFSVQNLLGEGEGRPVMDWATRVKIASGAARGIAYLHEDCHPRIIHRDIKSANILLDNNFEARVSDFGLAKLALDANTHITTRVIGTFGYMAPEYASSGKLTEKSDVFSFGVVLLELITGRKSVDPSQPLGEESLVEWARPLLSQALDTEEFEGLADSRLDKNYVDNEMFRMIEAAAACVRHSAAKRPRMGQVVRAFDSMAISDLTNGMRVGESEVFNSAEQSEEIRLFQRMAFGSQDHSTYFFSQASLDS